MNGATYEARGTRHFDGRTPEPRAATVRLEPGWLALEAADGTIRRWPLEQVRLVRAERSIVQLELLGEPIEALIVEETGFLDALKAANGGRRPAGLGSPVPALRLLLAIGAVFVALLFVAWRWGIPALAAVAADQVPPEWERRFGAEVVRGMARDRVEDARVVGLVNDVFERLVRAADSKRDSFVVIVAREKMVNAFAAPGGYVVVTTGLLEALRGPDELAAVMAHEISHVAKRHTTRGLFARLGVRALFALIAGDQSGLGPVAEAAGTLGELSYSRHDETEADEGAVLLLARAGVDPGAMDRALERIAEESGSARGPQLGFLSTHPTTAGRRERVRELAAKAGVAGAADPPDPARWERLREALKPPSAPR